MFSIGLTGGIGSGKSQVADWLGEWGAAVIDTDLIAHQLTAPGGKAMPALRAAFGAEAVGDDGRLNRPWMRTHVFENTQARLRLEAILHPLIRQEALQQAQTAQGLYVVYVVPLLAESRDWHDIAERICVVDSDPGTQIKRVMQRSGLTRDAIERIMSAQASRTDRLAMADDVIINDSDTDLATLRDRTHALHRYWSILATRHTSRNRGPDA